MGYARERAARKKANETGFSADNRIKGNKVSKKVLNFSASVGHHGKITKDSRDSGNFAGRPTVFGSICL